MQAAPRDQRACSAAMIAETRVSRPQIVVSDDVLPNAR
jgi:hypothetical protein